MHQPWVRPHGVSRGQAHVAFQFHGSLDLGIIVLRYVTLCNGRSRAVSSLARPGGPANATSAAQRDSRLFVGIPGASRLFGGRCRAGCPALMWRARSSAALSPTPAPRRAVCSRRSCRVARSGSCRRNTRNGGVASNGTANRPVQVVSVADYGLAWLDRTRPERRISLPSSVRVPRSKLRNRIAQLPSSRWASAIVSFRIASDR
jgi:hypothetical protein